MKGILRILIFLNLLAFKAQSQSFSVDDLFTLANLPSRNINSYLHKKGFVLHLTQSDSTETNATFIEKKKNKQGVEPKRSIDIRFSENAKKITLNTPALNEFQEGEKKLIKSRFFYDTLKGLSKEQSILFQKANISVLASCGMQDSIMQYSFCLTERSIPLSLRYAEDLLQFDSHEFLQSYFGVQNVKKDIFYLTEKELKRCTILFSGTQRQAVFVWDDDIYLNKLLYILVTNKLPTKSARESDPIYGRNEWRLKNGVYPGMELKDLLKINEVDFDIYGNKSELSFLIKPNPYGKIDFKKTAIMLSCHECYDNKIFNQNIVSALDVAKANLPMRVFDVAIYPSLR